MDQIYQVAYKGKVSGKTFVNRAGLYWNISCRCELPKGEMVRLRGSFEKGSIDHGLLYPVEGQFGLDTKVPCSKAGNKVNGFELVDQQQQETKIPLCAEDPFPYIAMLERCRFRRIDGKPYLILRNEKND